MQREMQRAKEREKERETLASPVTPVRSVKVKDISLYLSATRGPMCRIGKSPSSLSSLSSLSSPSNLSLGWISMFTTKGNCWRSVISITLSIFQQWNGVGIISYYLVQVLSSVGIDGVDNQTLINGFYYTLHLKIRRFSHS